MAQSSDIKVGDDFRIWEGIYDDFPAEDPEGVYVDGVWIDKHTKDVAAALALLDGPPPGCAFSMATIVHEYPLAIVAALAASGLQRSLRILDFGGGAGSMYPSLAACLPKEARCELHVVELPALVARGRSLLSGRAGVHFHRQLPDTSAGPFDVVHAGASIQYVKDWCGLLNCFAAYRPEWLVLGHVLAGPIRTFVTHQNVYGRQVPVWFLNLEELSAKIRRLGYRLIYHALMERTILGRAQPLPTEHFPAEYRLRYGCNLIFRHGA